MTTGVLWTIWQNPDATRWDNIVQTVAWGYSQWCAGPSRFFQQVLAELQILYQQQSQCTDRLNHLNHWSNTADNDFPTTIHGQVPMAPDNPFRKNLPMPQNAWSSGAARPGQ